MSRLGLPEQITACLFDLDGVITQTANVHARAWKQVFDEFLKARREPPFDLVQDYDDYVDGKPREDGVRSFLASRHITVPDETVHDIADRKDQLFLDLIHHAGVQTGRAGGFGLVVGVDRAGQANALYAQGADVVVKDLADLLAK